MLDMSSNFPLYMFDAQAPQGTVRFTCTGFHVRSSKPIVLIMRHAGYSNEAYVQARRAADLKLVAYGENPPQEVLFDHIIPVFAQTVVTDWENVLGHDAKTPVPCVPDEVEALLRALAHKNRDVVTRAMAHATSADNFRALVEALGNG